MNITKRIVQLREEREMLDTVPLSDDVSKEEEENRIEKEFDYNEKLSDCISHAMDMVSVQNELKPLKILGMNAQMGMAISIGTGALTFYSTLFSLYINSGNELADAASVA
jgi:hypothetical protein